MRGYVRYGGYGGCLLLQSSLQSDLGWGTVGFLPDSKFSNRNTAGECPARKGSPDGRLPVPDLRVLPS